MKFEVFVVPQRDEAPDPTLSAQLSAATVRAVQALLAPYKKDSLPTADTFFRLKGPHVFPSGDVHEWLYWNFLQGIGQLDDFRRLRQCSNHLNHAEPYFYLTTKVQPRETYFCSDDCRRHYHNNKPIQEKVKGRNDGR